MAKPAKTVAFLYGALEGPAHGKRFQQALTQAGYAVTPDPSSADIVVAHSGGCMLVPLDKPGQTTLLINPTYWPGNVPRKQAARKSMQDCRQYGTRNALRQLQHHLWNVWYLLTDWRHSRELLRAAKRFDFPNDIAIPAGRVIVVRNEHDPWLTDNLGALQQAHPNIQLVHLPGNHDDCWYNPQIYVNLLQSEV
jgi:hypothetical protein